MCHTRPRAIRRQVPVPLGFNVLFVGCLTAATGASWKWAGDRPHLPCARVLLRAFPGLIPDNPPSNISHAEEPELRGLKHGPRVGGAERWQRRGCTPGSRSVTPQHTHLLSCSLHTRVSVNLSQESCPGGSAHLPRNTSSNRNSAHRPVRRGHTNTLPLRPAGLSETGSWTQSLPSPLSARPCAHAQDSKHQAFNVPRD